jgi:hypothetical protein
MRTFWISSGCTVLLLAACAKPSPLPPATVLENAVRASMRLRSASFTLHAEQSGGKASGKTVIALDGRIQDGGKQIDTNGTVDASITDPNGRLQNVSGKGEVIVAAENEIYLRLDALSSQPELPFLEKDSSDVLLGNWWRLPANPQAAGADAASPDPYLLTLQTSALVVKSDHGISAFDGRDAYRYDVTIDPAKLREFVEESARQRKSPLSPAQIQALYAMTIEGEARIDAATFDVLRLEWTITDKTDAAARWKIEMTVADQNTAAPIAPPKDAKPLESATSVFLRALLPQGSIPDAPAGGTLSPDAQQRILDSLDRPSRP